MTPAPVPRPLRWALANAQVIGLCLVGIVAFASAGFSGCSRQAAEQKAADAAASAVTADETVQAAADAQRVVVDVFGHERAIDAQTRENRDAILSAEGAGSSIPADVARAGRHALCLRATYRADPACQQLRDADPD